MAEALMVSEAKELAKQEKQEKLEAALRQSALQELLRTTEGRSLLWWLFEITKVESTPFSLDPYGTAFQCGEQNIGQRLKAELVTADPEGYVKLLVEKSNERRNYQSSGDDGDPLDRDYINYHDSDPAD